MSRFASTNKHVFRATITSFIMMILYGLFLNMIGELLPPIIEDFGLSLTEAGLIQAFFNLGGIVTLVGMIYLSDIVKKSHQVFFSFLFFAIVLAATGLFAYSYALIVIAFILFGFSTKIFDVSINAYVNDINTKGREFFLQLLHVFFGIGAVLGPISASYFTGTKFGWRGIFLFLGAACIVMVVVSLFTVLKTSSKTEQVHDENKDEQLNLISLFKNPQIWILTLCSMFSSGSYIGLVTWFPSYAKYLDNESGKLSGVILSVYFIGFVFSRLISSLVLKKENARFLIILTSLGGLASLSIALIIPQTWAFFVFLFLAGLFTGATHPIIIFTACLNFPRNTGGVTSIIYTGIAIMAIIVPFIMGVVGDASNIVNAMPWTVYAIAVSLFFSFFVKKYAD